MRTTMTALAIDRLGDAEELHLAEVAVPRVFASEVLVRVHAAGINPIDVKTRSGQSPTAAGITSWPAVLGYDFSGVVEQAPYAAHPLQQGTEVFGMANVPRAPGSYAELVSASVLSLAPKPDNLSHIEAAGVPLAAMTAWGMVVDVARVHAGQRVLIHAGSGGVGHFAVQFARYFGAHVIATGSAQNGDFLHSLGATEVIDYRAERFEERLRADRAVDVVIDLIGNVHDGTGSRSLAALRPGGLLVNAPTGSWSTMADEAAAAGIRATGFKLAADARTLATIARLIEWGEVSVHIDEVFPLAEGAAAHRRLEEGHTRGKIVLTVA